MKFKDSPIGKLPIHWDTKLFKDFVFFQEGPGLRRWQFQDTGMKVLNVTNIKGEGVIDMSITDRYISLDEFDKKYKHFSINNGDIVIASSGNTIGKIGRIYSDQLPAIVNTSTIRFNNSLHPELLDQEFLYAYLKSDVFFQQLISYSTGSAQPNVGPTHIAKMYLPVPPIEEQRVIGKYINDIDVKIDLNRRINKTIENMAQVIFKSWFVNFEPVKAKIAALAVGGSEEDALLAAMQAISGKDGVLLTQLQVEQPKQYAELRATAELFPSAMQDSELGEIPEGWEISSIGDEVEIAGGGTPPTKNPEFWINGTIHWTTPKDLSNSQDKVMISTERKITEKGLSKISSRLLPIGTVLMSSRAPVGYLALTKLPVAINQGYIAMICSERLTSEYVLQWTNSVMDDIQQRASGTTFAEISKKNFKIIPVIVPSTNLIAYYTRITSLYYSTIETNLRNSCDLSELRDSLLPRLLSGELEV